MSPIYFCMALDIHIRQSYIETVSKAMSQPERMTTMTPWTTDNSTYSAEDRAKLNDALTQLLVGFDPDDHDYDQIQRSFSDRLANAMVPGITVDELVLKADFR